MTLYQNWWGGGDSISPFRHRIRHGSGWNTGLFSNVLAHGPVPQVSFCALQMFCCDLSPPPRIDESSPLWTMSPDSLKEEKFEIILTLEGIVPETGNNIQVHKCGFYYLLRKQIMFQVRTSYLPTEILWGYKFEHSCVEYNPKLATYEVSFESLNTMIRDNTPW